MNSFISLTKTLISSLSMSKPQDRRRKIITNIFSFFIVFFVMVPAAFFCGFFVKMTAEMLSGVGGEAAGLHLVLHVLALFTLVFGFNVILNQLYFSSDIEFLLPWPLKARQIMASKFTAAYVGENLMQFIFVAASVIGFWLGAGMSVGRTIFSVIGVVTLPLLPMAYCAILSMLIMSFTGIIKNRDTIQKVTMILIFGVLIAILIGAVSLMNVDFNQAIMQLATGDQTFFSVMDIIFPNVSLLMESIHNDNILAFLGYILVNVAAVAVMLLLSEALYLRGVIRLSSLPEKKRSQSFDSLLKKSRQRSAGVSYFLKEVRLLIRSPMYLTHCVLVNFIWPVFAYAVYCLLPDKYSMEEMHSLYMQNESVGFLFGAAVVTGVTMLLASLNSIGSNAISREGKHFPFMKYIPVPYKTQWNAKSWVSVMFTVIGVLVFAIPFAVILQLPPLHILAFAVLCILSAMFVSYMGVYMDSIQPKLVWDYESSVLRENYNMFYCMGIVIVLVGVLCVGGYFLFSGMGLPVWLIGLIYGGTLAALNLLVYCLLLRSGGRNIAEQEEM